MIRSLLEPKNKPMQYKGLKIEDYRPLYFWVLTKQVISKQFFFNACIFKEFL